MAQNYLSITILITQTNKCWFKMREKNNIYKRTSQGRAGSQKPQHKQTIILWLLSSLYHCCESIRCSQSADWKLQKKKGVNIRVGYLQKTILTVSPYFTSCKTAAIFIQWPDINIVRQVPYLLVYKSTLLRPKNQPKKSFSTYIRVIYKGLTKQSENLA